MAPEQLEGRDADARSDLFAFGAMVYEMATGRRVFEGTTAATVIGAILHTDPPPLSTLQPLAPPALDRIVSRCLAKDPDDRWQTARDLMLELKWVAEHAAPLEAAREREKNWKLGFMAAAALAVVVIAAAPFTVAYLRRAPSDDSLVRFSFSPPDGLTLTDVRTGGPITISPDGERLTFVASGSDGTQRLWVRPLDSVAAHALAGTEGAAYPFWSPDSRFLGFFAQGKLKKIQASGGPPQIICDATVPVGGTWNGDGIILFAAGAGHQLARVSAGGGMPTLLPDDPINEERLRPSFLPDGRHFVYYGRPQKWGIYVASVDSANTTRFLREGVGSAYASGHLLVLLGATRGSDTGTLWAQPFDVTRLQITGEALPVAEQVTYYSGRASSAFSVSGNGRLIYGSFKSPATQLIWFDRSGKPLGSIGGSAVYRRPSLSPDEKTIVVTRVDPETQQDDLWSIETTRGIASRFTSNPNFEDMPVWSPDGTRIAFTSPRNTPPNLYQKTLTGDGEEPLVKSSSNDQPTDWSRDGRFIFYQSLHPKTQWDLWFLPMSGAEADRKPVPFLQTGFNERLGRLSPDGRWLAYASDESGTDEVYVRTFPKSDAQRQLSANGGSAPRWRADARELFYLATDGRLMAVSVKAGPTFQAGAPVALFQTRISGNDYPGAGANYTATRDGQRFLISTVTGESNAVPTTIVLNWPAALGRR
jgi:Tol biopolymer transport system component